MGKKLDALLGRTFKFSNSKFKSLVNLVISRLAVPKNQRRLQNSKLKPLVNLAISRLAILKKQRQVRCSQARFDVVQLLEQGHHTRALLRVEEVIIREQNMLDAFVMMEGYCNLLIARVHLIKQERECPDELKEAIASLIFAASRCGDFPEIQEIRAVLTSHYGKEFVDSATELRNNCGVNLTMFRKLSTRQPDSSENGMKVLKKIAAEKSIVLQLEEGPSVSTEERVDVSKTLTTSGGPKLGDNLPMSPEEIENNNDVFSDSMRGRKEYRDVADAAQEASELAAYAAAAARATVELSRSDSYNPDDQDSPNLRQRKASDKNEPMKHKSESENKEIHSENQAQDSKQSTNVAELKSSISDSSSNSADDIVEITMMSSDEVDLAKLLEREIVFYESDNETHYSVDMKSRSGLKVKTGPGHSAAHTGEGSKMQGAQKGPFSVKSVLNVCL